MIRKIEKKQRKNIPCCLIIIMPKKDAKRKTYYLNEYEIIYNNVFIENALHEPFTNEGKKNKDKSKYIQIFTKLQTIFLILLNLFRYVVNYSKQLPFPRIPSPRDISGKTIKLVFANNFDRELNLRSFFLSKKEKTFPNSGTIPSF